LPRYNVVPALMATQHPDSATKYFSASEEVEEAVQDLAPLELNGYGCDEKMIDYEGKLTPFLQPKWITRRMYELYRERLIPEKDFILTIRAPSADLEAIDRQLLALLSGILANIESERLYNAQVVKYIIHPMTSNVRSLIAVQRRLNKLLNLAREELGLAREEDIDVIPLIEDVRIMFNLDAFIHCYRIGLSNMLGLYRDSLRVLIGKSDAALAYGHLPSVLGIKVSLWKLHELSEKEGIAIYPILGAGALPFRGHLSPLNASNYVKEYAGYHTVTLQSGFRFDFRKEDVINAIQILSTHVGARPNDPGDIDRIRSISRLLTERYLEAILPSMKLISKIADLMPRRRERLGRALYGRNLTSVAHFVSNRLRHVLTRTQIVLPRAIRYTAALYTMGIPPSFIGTGRGLRDLKSDADLVLDAYPSLRDDLNFDAQFLCLDIARECLPPKSFKLIEEDCTYLFDLFGITAAPLPEYHDVLIEIHKRLSKGLSIEGLVTKTGQIRGSLG